MEKLVKLDMAGNCFSRKSGLCKEVHNRRPLINVYAGRCNSGWDDDIRVSCSRNGKYASAQVQIVCHERGVKKLPFDEWYGNIKYAVRQVLMNTEPDYSVSNYWF